MAQLWHRNSPNARLFGHREPSPPRHWKRLAAILLLLVLVIAMSAGLRSTTWFGPWLADGFGRVIGGDRWR